MKQMIRFIYKSNNNNIMINLKRLILMFMVLMLMFTSVNAQTQNELLSWQFKTGSGSVVFDSTGNDYNGILQGATWSANARWGSYSIIFDGVNDFVSGLSTVNTPNVITISAWMNPNDNNNWYLFEIDDTIESIEIEYDNTLNILSFNYYNDAQIYSSFDLETFDFVSGQWYHLLFTIDNTQDTITYYRDNNPILTNVSVTGGINKGETIKTLRLGSNHANLDYLKGNIDSFRIFDSYLNNSQIESLYNTNTIVLDTDIVDNNNNVSLGDVEIINYYSPINGSSINNPAKFEVMTNYKSNCELYIDNSLVRNINNIFADTYQKVLEFGNHDYFYVCSALVNNTIVYDLTNITSFNVIPNDPFEISFNIVGTDFDMNSVELYLVTPCLNEGVSAIGTEYKPFRPEYNTGGASFSKVENGFASLIVTEELNKFCVINGRFNINGEGKTTDYSVVEAYKQINLGEIRTPNNNSNNSYLITLEQFDIYGKANPKAWGQSWTTLISGMILLIIGVGIVLVGSNLNNGKIVIGGVILCLASMGISFTGFLGVLI